jgi:hypothetical protein
MRETVAEFENLLIDYDVESDRLEPEGELRYPSFMGPGGPTNMKYKRFSVEVFGISWAFVSGDFEPPWIGFPSFVPQVRSPIFNRISNALLRL